MTPHNEVEGGHRLGVVVDIIVIAHVDHLSTSALLNESLDRQHNPCWCNGKATAHDLTVCSHLLEFLEITL